jgi:NitT/TauT family transport system permease protein
MATTAFTVERKRGNGLSLFRRPSTRVALVRLVVPLVVLIAWAVLARVSTLVPSIGATVTKLVDGIGNGVLITPLLDTLEAVGVGFAAALVVGVAVGMSIGWSKLAFRVFEPLLNALFAVPRIILYPVLLAAFGVGLQSKVWMVAISAVFPIALNTLAGMRQVDPTLIKLGRSLHCSRLQMATHIYGRAAAPAIMVGIRLGVSIALVSAIIAELFAAQNGIGLLIQQYYSLQQYASMFAAVILITGIALALNLVAWLLEQRISQGVS